MKSTCECYGSLSVSQGYVKASAYSQDALLNMITVRITYMNEDAEDPKRCVMSLNGQVVAEAAYIYLCSFRRCFYPKPPRSEAVHTFGEATGRGWSRQ